MSGITSEMSLQLSESLYPVDEVIATFIQCLLAKHPLDECLFWLWELIYTTPNICEGIISLYQQFYSHTNHNVGRYIVRKLQEYCNDGEKRHIADIVNNLLKMSSSPDAYYIVKASQSCDGPTVMYKRTSWMFSYPTNMSCLLGAIKSRNIKNIGAYASLSLATNGFAPTKSVLILYAHSVGKPDIDTGICDGGIITIAYLIARIINHIALPATKFMRANADSVLKMEEHFNMKSTRLDNLLAERRLYSTHSFMPPADYGRFTTGTELFENECRLRWAYYCFNSVEWNKRFTHSGCYLDHNKRQVIWQTDESLDAFYSNGYCIDFDEQPRCVMNMSLHPIDVICDPVEWYETIIVSLIAKMLV